MRSRRACSCERTDGRTPPTLSLSLTITSPTRVRMPARNSHARTQFARNSHKRPDTSPPAARKLVASCTHAPHPRPLAHACGMQTRACAQSNSLNARHARLRALHSHARMRLRARFACPSCVCAPTAHIHPTTPNPHAHTSDTTLQSLKKLHSCGKQSRMRTCEYGGCTRMGQSTIDAPRVHLLKLGAPPQPPAETCRFAA
jgi:hypothetical protein